MFRETQLREGIYYYYVFFSVFKINFFFSEIESIKIKENDEKMKLRSQLNQEKKLTEEVKLKNS